MAVYYKGREINEIDYIKVEENIIEVNNQNKTIDITENGTQTITYDEGYTGLESIVINTNVETSSGDCIEIVDGIKFAYSNWTEVPSFVKPYLETQSDWENMFYNNTKLNGTLDLTDINNNNVISLNNTFASCYNLKYINISNLKVSNILGMFSVSNKLIEVNITNIDISTIISSASLFSYCSKLEKINVSGWIYPTSMSQLITYNNMFTSCTSLTSLILGDVTQEQYDWWYARLADAGIQNNVTITYNLIS